MAPFCSNSRIFAGNANPSETTILPEMCFLEALSASLALVAKRLPTEGE